MVVLEERVAALVGSVRQHLEWLALEFVVVAVVVVRVAPALARLDGEAFGFDGDEAAVEEAVAGSGDAGSCLASTMIPPPVVVWRGAWSSKSKGSPRCSARTAWSLGRQTLTSSGSSYLRWRDQAQPMTSMQALASWAPWGHSAGERRAVLSLR